MCDISGTFPGASPLFILEISAAVVKADVHLLSQSSLHNSAATFKESQKVFWVQHLQLLFFS